MFSCKTSFVFFFLFASKTAHAFILLTANVEDIKKIAKKFVSDELADKLANTVVKIIEKVNGKDVEAELNKPQYATERDLIKDMMSPYYEASRGAQRFQKATRQEDPLERSNRQFDNQMYKERGGIRTSRISLRNWDLPQRPKTYDHQNFAAVQPHHPQIKSNHPHIQGIHNAATRKSIPHISPNQFKSNYHSSEIQSQYVPKIKPILNQDLIENNRDLFAKNPSTEPEVRKHRNVDLFYEKYPEKSWHPSQHTVEPFIITPKRENFEIEPYLDKLSKGMNLNDDYKIDAIATSGDLGLTKLKEQRWWQEEKEREEQNTTPKVNNGL